MATSINLDLQTQESAYLYIFRELEYFIPSQIVHGLSWEIAHHARVEAISRHEPNMQVQLRFFIDIKYVREIVDGEHPEPETEALQQEEEIIADEILEDEIEETATEFEFRQFIELSSQEGYIFEGEYRPMETDNLQLLRAIEASAQVDFPLRPAARSAVQSLARPDIEAQEEVVCTVCMCNISAGDGRVLPCSHIYHADCIFRWLELRNSCPICRFQLPVQE
ncbi:E3 ubiquitin-protein ligase RNF6 [Amborella trichopoda]|uniref:RING-type domain-containing protein n=1 Tax=Amborella trichopoda TaxID=13333 RepID=W1NH73_AMBTC|nr:E3 ubiquitin-protein ligase RNF6 [Amborella trichopoda]ERM95142.1 hypothetical protein AMTR_s00009p00261080 [Amborella trichopoda]|eukprot:XP_006827726.1 E3 ubiquitin-protein ligase RNF6 [Amborella trichopoda]